MAKFAFTVPPLTGHINPTLSVGAALIRRGHEVGWITLDSTLQERLPEKGQMCHIQYREDDHKRKENEKYLDIISKKIVYGVESIKFLYEEVLIPLNRHMMEGIEHELDQFQPDVVIHDHQVFAGAMAAHRKNIPYATSVTAPAAIKIVDELPKIHEWEVNQIVGLQQECGIPGNRSLACSDDMTLVFTSREFFGDMNLPGNYQFVGPVIQHRPGEIPFNWDAFYAMKHPRKILISIGTTFDHAHKKDFFAKVIEALRNEPVSVIVVSDPDLFDEWPDNFMVQARVPQLALLIQMDAVVCHAGHNTVCETLSHGLPMVVIPIAYDQSHVAGRVVQAESGIRLNFKRFNPGHLRVAIREVLKDPKYKHAARQIQTSFQQAGGTEKAALLLEGMVGTKARSVAVA